MQRQSESIASLAAALAKAQIELQNPEKSLVGSIEAKPNAPERLFRYASLASGLEIVRKTLGQHDIATVQTTAIDQTSGIVNLTTVLAHASGEWISSDWPVCPISETATPHRMGAALTYARRYALFTLVGIAGEDDLDAPDLVTPTPQTVSKPPSSERPRRAGNGVGRLNGGQRTVEHRTPVEAPKKTFTMYDALRLDAEASAKLRDQMIAELNQVGSSEEAARWAKRRYPDKTSKLNAADAAAIDQCFRSKIIGFAAYYADGVPEERDDGAPRDEAQSNQVRPSTTETHTKNATDANANGETKGDTEATAKSTRKKSVASQVVDKSVLSFPEPRRVRDRDHVRYVAQQSCLVCGRKPCDAHHLRFAQTRALGRKVSDEFTVPLCRGHHRELHRHGDELKWWREIAIDPIAVARTLWLETHSLAGEPGDRQNRT
jgi:predicted  nucleic acid-binding Zn-ribbon protein